MTTAIRLLATLLVTLSWACDPADTCDGDQFYANGQCVPCPAGSTVMGGTCVCDDEQAVYDDDECKLPNSDVAATNEDAGIDRNSEASCMTYCSFIRECLGDNPIVQGVAAEVVAGVGVDGQDVARCLTECLVTADDPRDQIALGCFESSAMSATCQGDQSIAGVEEALTVVDDCCTDRASGLCERLCAAVSTSEIAVSMVPACQ